LTKRYFERNLMKLDRPAQKKHYDSTIPLINIVFLMLIFFLVAGNISPPLQSDIELALAKNAEATAFPDSLVISKEGLLFFQDNPVSVDEFLLKRLSEKGEEAKIIEIIADKNLNAQILLNLVASLRQKGAEDIQVITQVDGS